MMIGGHRGFGRTDSAFAQEMPVTKGKPAENTLESIRKTYRAGGDFVEFDTIQTKDDRIVVLHSNRLSDHFFIPLSHEFVAELTLEELQKLPVGAEKNGFVSTLDDILKMILDEADFSNDFVVNIELKDVKEDPGIPFISQSPKHKKGHPTLITLVADIIRKVNFPLDKIMFSSFSYHDLIEMKKIFPNGRYAALFERGDTDLSAKMYPDQNLDHEMFRHFTKENINLVLSDIGVEAVHPYFFDVTDDMIAFCASKGLMINAWFYMEAMPEENREKILHVMNTCKKHNVPFNLMTDYTPEMVAIFG